jgi:hypothetical protein
MTTAYDPLLSADDAAKYLGGVSRRTLRRFDIQRVPIPGRGSNVRTRWGYRLSALNAFLERANDPKSRKPLVRKAS